MLTKVATFRGTTDSGEPLVHLFHPGHKIKVAGVLMPQVKDWMATYKPQPGKIAILVNALGSSEYWGQNSNGDIFPESALLHDCRKHPSEQHPYDSFTGKIIPPYGYWTFKFAHPFVHHKNKDPSRAFGEVVLCVWNPRMHRVELIVVLDVHLAMQHGAQHVVDRIMTGDYPDVSMGCRVPYDVCTICRNKSKTRNDYCSCVKEIGMGKILDDGRRIGVVNLHPRFFDISFVFIGADKTAKMMCKLASGLWVPKSVADAQELYDVQEDENGLVKAACGRGTCRECLKECKVKTAFRKQANGGDDDEGRAPTKEDKTKILSWIKSHNNAKDEEYHKFVEGLGINVHKAESFVYDQLHELTKNAEPRIAGVSLEESDRILAGKSDADDSELLLGPADEQKSTSVYVSGDGVVRTNHEDSVVDDEKRASSFSLLMKAATAPLLAAAAKKVPVGPPPTRNRKDHPFVGTINFRGIQINIENKAGDIREGQDRNGKKWRTVMKFPYGEFDKVKATGMDGDKLDVYVGPFRDAPNVYVIHQNVPSTGKYDEDKVMLGFRNEDEAKAAYLSQYNSPKFFRSVTTMAFPLFKKALLGGELDGEKVAYSAIMEKVAEELKLEDLFESKAPRRRQRIWRDKVTGKETKVTGSGMGSFDKAKTASIKKTAKPLTPHEMLKVSDEKVGDLQKWSDIVKEIGPSAAVGKVTPLLNSAEPDIPKDTLNEMGEMPLEKSLATPSLMGMVLKPREFQRIMLAHSGRGDLADTLDDAGAVFRPSADEMAPCQSLDKGDLAQALMKALMPLLGEKSYYGPVLRRRIIKITISAPPPETPEHEVESPLLSKVASAYNWYRREQMKLAAEGPEVVVSNPELHSAIYGLGDADLFGKEAASPARMLVGHTADVAKEVGRLDPKTLAVVLGSIPISMMYSSHLRGKQRQGKEMGILKNLVADHPWLASIGIAAGLREIMKTPQAQQLADEAFQAGKRVWFGKGSPQAANML